MRRMTIVVLAVTMLAAGSAMADNGMLGSGTRSEDDGGGGLGSGSRSGLIGSGTRTEDDGGGTIGSGTRSGLIGSGTRTEESGQWFGNGGRTEDGGLMGSGGRTGGESARPRLLDLIRAMGLRFLSL